MKIFGIMTLKFGFKREEEHLSDSNICAGFHCQGVQRARICGGPEGQNTIHHNTTLIKLRQFYKTQQNFTKQDNRSYYGTGETVCFVTRQNPSLSVLTLRATIWIRFTDTKLDVVWTETDQLNIDYNPRNIKVTHYPQFLCAHHFVEDHCSGQTFCLYIILRCN